MSETRVEPEIITTRTRGTIKQERWFYGPTCLIDERGDGSHTLFARRFREIEMPSGKVVHRAARSVERFPDAVQMGEAIEERSMVEWPELDANPHLSTPPPPAEKEPRHA